jgi:hypothetical protein
MLGPESYLLDLARRAGAESRERYLLALRSYASAIVLYDPESIWPDVIQTVRRAAYRFGGRSDLRQRRWHRRGLRGRYCTVSEGHAVYVERREALTNRP